MDNLNINYDYSAALSHILIPPGVGVGHAFGVTNRIVAVITRSVSYRPSPSTGHNEESLLELSSQTFSSVAFHRLGGVQSSILLSWFRNVYRFA